MSGRCRVDWTMKTPEKREERLAQARAYKAANREQILAQRAEYRRVNAEKIYEKQRAYYEENTEKVLESNRKWRAANIEKLRQRELKRFNIHKPDGRVPADLLKRVRIKCLDLGGNPAVTDDMRLAILAVAYESPELQNNWLHAGFINETAASWSRSWRQKKPLSRVKFMMDYKAGKLS